MASVLIVDDAKIMRLRLRTVIERLGHRVEGEAENGAGAIEKVKSLNPDIITMDITMPEVSGVGDGIDTTKKIREFNKDVKIIMITSHGEQKKVISAIQSGASSYILKPVTEDKIKEVISKIL
jgi:two-component system chemotaxis response regulator CheY